MENLNKENFWNEAYEAFPTATKVFCDWIDKWKKDNHWNKLFNSDSNWQDKNGKNAKAPKFHDLPLEMQIGIWLAFEIDNGYTDGFSSKDFSLEVVMECVKFTLWMMEIKLNKPKKQHLTN